MKLYSLVYGPVTAHPAVMFFALFSSGLTPPFLDTYQEPTPLLLNQSFNFEQRSHSKQLFPYFCNFFQISFISTLFTTPHTVCLVLCLDNSTDAGHSMHQLMILVVFDLKGVTLMEGFIPIVLV